MYDFNVCYSRIFLKRQLLKLTIAEKAIMINGATTSGSRKNEITKKCSILPSKRSIAMQNENGILHKYESNKVAVKITMSSECPPA